MPKSEQSSKDVLTIEELASRWEVSKQTLNLWRYRGTGPAFLKIGRLVRYPLSSVEAYERQQIRNGHNGQNAHDQPCA